MGHCEAIPAHLLQPVPRTAASPEPKDKRRLEYRNKPAIRFAHGGLRFIRGMRRFAIYYAMPIIYLSQKHQAMTVRRAHHECCMYLLSGQSRSLL